ncbi:MAG: topoisomerase DNA-binding C4 zinc finger domain-containing protein, partial [Candidatus Latescibacterota bacterium]
MAQTCPQCGSPMWLRTARRGAKAGSQFWGCSRYPACKAIVAPVPAAPAGDGPSTVGPAPAAARVLPLRAAAAARERRGQSTFFQACGLPAAFVKRLHLADADRRLVRAAAQWRLDFPLPHGEGVSIEDRDVLAVVESLLTRGATPLCSPSLERALGAAAVAPGEDEPVVEAVRRAAMAPSCRFRPLWFDSAEERAVFDWVLGQVEHHGLPWSLIPQVELACLHPAIEALSAERGDLLLGHVERDAILVEVDGAEHGSHRERDERRDRTLNLVGVRVIRVPASEARDGRGRSLDALLQLLLDGRVDLPPRTEFSRTVRWCQFLHQVQLALVAALRGGWLRLGAPWCIGVAPPKPLCSDPLAAELIPLAVDDFLELLGRVARLHERSIPTPHPRVALVADGSVERELDVLVGPADGSADAVSPVRGRFLVSDVCFPAEIHAPLTAASPMRLAQPQREDARWFLRYLFRKD